MKDVTVVDTPVPIDHAAPPTPERLPSPDDVAGFEATVGGWGPSVTPEQAAAQYKQLPSASVQNAFAEVVQQRRGNAFTSQMFAVLHPHATDADPNGMKFAGGDRESVAIELGSVTTESQLHLAGDQHTWSSTVTIPFSLFPPDKVPAAELPGSGFELVFAPDTGAIFTYELGPAAVTFHLAQQSTPACINGSAFRIHLASGQHVLVIFHGARFRADYFEADQREAADTVASERASIAQTQADLADDQALAAAPAPDHTAQRATIDADLAQLKAIDAQVAAREDQVIAAAPAQQLVEASGAGDSAMDAAGVRLSHNMAELDTAHTELARDQQLAAGLTRIANGNAQVLARIADLNARIQANQTKISALDQEQAALRQQLSDGLHRRTYLIDQALVRIESSTAGAGAPQLVQLLEHYRALSDAIASIKNDIANADEHDAEVKRGLPLDIAALQARIADAQRALADAEARAASTTHRIELMDAKGNPIVEK